MAACMRSHQNGNPSSSRLDTGSNLWTAWTETAAAICFCFFFFDQTVHWQYNGRWLLFRSSIFSQCRVALSSRPNTIDMRNNFRIGTSIGSIHLFEKPALFYIHCSSSSQILKKNEGFNTQCKLKTLRAFKLRNIKQ